MKPIKFANLLLFGLVLTTVIPGCRKTPGGMENIPPGFTENPRVPLPPTPPIEGGTNPWETNTNSQAFAFSSPTNHMTWHRDSEMFKSDTVHFAFDSAVVRTDQKPKVAAVAAYLKSNPAKAVEIEGHCDERGTAEYNRALGERRALALREELIRLGIEPVRVDTISYGFDRPVDSGHTPAAWAKNRRGEFILLTPPSGPVE
jgi:peptidoglycan-associated lipoprotein